MATADQVVVEFEARVGKYEADLKRAASTFEKTTGVQEARIKAVERQMQASAGNISSTLKGLAATFATYFTGRELVGLLDSFTRLQNNLRVAGVEGDNMKAVQDRLFASAQKYGVELEGLSSLYSGLSQASVELGATQEQVFQVTDNVSAALKIMGIGSEQATGALLQLKQIFQGNKVEMADFRSLIDGLYPLLQAAAAGSDRWKGSVGALIRDVRASTVTTQEFFQAILKGSDVLEGLALKATLTLSAGVTTLTNALVVYFGEADKANGVSAALGEALKLLADNLDRVIPALAIVGTALGVGFVTNALKAAAAARGVGAAIMAALGGPVGLAITGVVVALGAVATSSAEAESAMLANARAAQQMGLQLSEAEKAALAAAGETEGVGTDAAKAEPKMWSFKNAVDGLTQSLWEQAKAARSARLELLQQRESDAEARIAQARANTTSGQAGLLAQGGGRLRQGDVLGGLGDIGKGVLGRINNFIRRGNPEKQAKAIIDDANALRAAIVKEIEKLKNTPIGAGDVPATPGGGGAVTAGAAAGRGRAGTGGGGAGQVDVEAARRQAITEEAAKAAELARLQDDLLAARAAMARSAEDALAFELQQIENEKTERLKQYQTQVALGELTATEFDERRKLLEAISQQRAEQAKQAKADADRRATAALAALEVDTLHAAADIASTLAARRDLEIRALEIQQRIERDMLEQSIAQGQIADAGKSRALLTERQQAETTRVTRSNQGALGRYLERTGDPRAAAEEAAVRELESVRDGLAEGLAAQIGVKNEFIKSLLSIFLDDVLFRPMAEALSGTSGGGGLFGSIIGGIFGRASGGPVSAGRPYLVGENGPELMVPRQAGMVVPNGALRAQGAQTVISSPRFDLRGAVVTEQLYSDMERISRANATEAARRSYGQAMRDAPAAVRAADRYGG